MCIRDSVHTHQQKIISTVLLALDLYLLGLVWFWFFIGRLSRFCWLFSIFCHSFIHSFIYLLYVRRLYCHYYFILVVTISHIITVKSLIVLIRKPRFFGGGELELDRCGIIMWGQLGVTLCDRKGEKVLKSVT